MRGRLPATHAARRSMEFRCFVRGRELVAACQRDYTTFYASLPPAKARVLADIVKFFETVVRARFAEADYTFDVYRPKKGRVTLIDFNPFAPVTDGLLFDWDEPPLCGAGAGAGAAGPEFRIISTAGEAHLRPSLYMTSRLPKDVQDMALNNKDDIESLAEMYKAGKLDPAAFKDGSVAPHPDLKAAAPGAGS